jgi:hypothetical protein
MARQRHTHRAGGPRRRRYVVLGFAVLTVVAVGLGLSVATGIIRFGGDGSAVRQKDLFGASRSATASPAASASASVTPSAGASPSPTKRPVTVPDGSYTCFPYPARKANFTPDIKLEPGVTLAPKYLDEAKKLWQEQWPPAWATFAAPSDLNDTSWGVRHVLITNGGEPQTGPATYKMKASDVVAQVDGTGIWDIGLHMHEGAHSIVNPFKFKCAGAPKFYSEGVTDFIRYTARGEGGIDRGWTLANQTDSSFLDESNVWQGGYRPSARFLLWLTEHYDTSGGDYRMLHDLNARLVSGNRDWQGIFTQIFGWSFHELFQAYRANPKINKHC